MPRALYEAISELEHLMQRGIFGDDVVAHYLNAARVEQETYDSDTRGTASDTSNEADAGHTVTGIERVAAPPAAADPARAARVQNALYRIASAANIDRALDEFYAEMHTIVGELMYAENFYIALYDPVRDALSYPYNVDTADPEVIDPKASTRWAPRGWRVARRRMSSERAVRPISISSDSTSSRRPARSMPWERSVTSVIG